jgi:hypothetical protein
MVDLLDHDIWRSHIPSDVSAILEVARTGRFFMKTATESYPLSLRFV